MDQVWDKMDNIEIWKNIRHTEGWNAIEQELDKRIRTEMEALTMCGPSDLIPIQERIKALNELKRMPEQVIRREEGQVSQ